MVYVGVDLHRKRSHVVALDEEGEILSSKRIDNEPEEFFRIFGELAPAPIEVAFEATYGWAWFADLLSDAGIPVHMAHPGGTKAITSARVKNDALDAKTLAHLLRTNLLPEAWMAPPEIREARRLVRQRVSLTRIRSRLKCQVQVILADYRLSSPVSDLFGVGGRAFLESLELPEIPAARLAAMLRLIDATTTEIASAESEMRTLFRGDPRIPRLMAIPGIGFLSAATILTEIGDVGRFSTPERLCSWAGLTPREHSSDAHTRRGHISKQGSRWLRWVLVEAAAHPGLKDHPDLRRFRDRIEVRRGRKVVRVALARRLLTLCFYALRDERGCRSFPITP